MKKNLYFLLFLFMLLLQTQISTAQNIGFVLGFNSSYQKHKTTGFIEDLERFGNKTGFNFGVNYRKRLDTKLYFLTGLNYIQKGSNRNGNDERADNVRESMVRLNYLEIPFTFLVSNNKPVSPILELGLQGGYLISGRYIDEEFEVTVNDTNKKIDIGARLGVGLNLYQFTLGLRYEFGLRNLNNSSADVNTKNHSYIFELTYWPKLN